MNKINPWQLVDQYMINLKKEMIKEHGDDKYIAMIGHLNATLSSILMTVGMESSDVLEQVLTSYSSLAEFYKTLNVKVCI